MMNNLAPFALFMGGALILPFFTGRTRNWLLLALAALGFAAVWSLEPGTSLTVPFLGRELQLLRVDKLSKVFGYVFTLNAFAAFLFAFKLDDIRQHVAALFYMGASLGAVFAGDLISLYVFWEIMAVASTFLILARGTKASSAAGFRYVMVHLFGGLCLLVGIILHVSSTGSTAFEAMTQQTPGTWLMLLGILVNASAFPFSSWLSDAYPEATVTGGVILSAYTTKTAVYALLRAYPGWDILIVIGCVMVVYGIIYALLENDMRRILAYSITNQVGFMVTGAGIGTAMAINGAAAHAFCHIIYKALLWMSAGAVLSMTGRSKCTELGGLYKSMPFTMIFGTIGALAISSFPATSGFTSKSLIIMSAADQHLAWAWLMLEIASAGVFLHAGIKFPFFVFFNVDRGLRPKEAPMNMQMAMGLLAFLCIFLGVYPEPLYAILPFELESGFSVYGFGKVVGQLQLLMFSALVFFLFLPLLKRTDTIALEVDWLYRKGGQLFYVVVDKVFNGINAVSARLTAGAVRGLAALCDSLPATAAVIITAPVNWLSGSERRNGHAWKAFVQEALATGTVPTGATILVITLGLACLVAVALVL
ncbi:multisubunit sodium/proton antiporter, MrpD subunit [Desulfocurvibacter africanus PCS]|uniref:Multisubunit sodium/proton antiporter, MrpD subunit n=1 Tax=Desulfocurvibacter africanus PCS TaxID=1262666 RepID=M5PQD5_DESAF|nr:Na(+)/H(+) antiporter subunit D [Desulfocurvibacter africanus]EMG36537.1 multisubunit sodium/proton antiporter, MrpD subunit [Desulfocurvibacter africanus PCS]